MGSNSKKLKNKRKGIILPQSITVNETVCTTNWHKAAAAAGGGDRAQALKQHHRQFASVGELLPVEDDEDDGWDEELPVR